MYRRKTQAALAVVLLLALPAGAAGTDVGPDAASDERFGTALADQLSRSVELPAHRWLETRRTAPGAALAEFTTDGCSGGMSSIWTFTAEQFPAFAEAHLGVPPWQECCVTHDHAYHNAGEDPSPEASYDARLAADEVLRACVRQTADSRDEILMAEYGLSPEQVRTAYKAVSAAMFHAVRLGGGPCTGLPWRWGYGWAQCWSEQDQP